MSHYLLKEFSYFNRKDLWSKKQFLIALGIFLIWALPAFIIVFLYSKYFPNSAFLCGAITEGIGPNLWNFIGSLGLISFGLTLIFSKNIKFLEIISVKILSTTFAIGSLTFGLLLGQWYFLLTTSNLVWWIIGFLGVTSGLLILVIFLCNLVIWYLLFLIAEENEEKSQFLNSLEKMHFIFRFIIGIIIISITSVLFTQHVMRIENSSSKIVVNFCDTVSKSKQ